MRMDKIVWIRDRSCRNLKVKFRAYKTHDGHRVWTVCMCLGIYFSISISLALFFILRIRVACIMIPLCSRQIHTFQAIFLLHNSNAIKPNFLNKSETYLRDFLFVSHFVATENFIHILSNCFKLVVRSASLLFQHIPFWHTMRVCVCGYQSCAHSSGFEARTQRVQAGRRKIAIQPIETHNCDFHFKRKIQFITYD